MSVLMSLDAVQEAGRIGPITAEIRKGEWLHLVGPNGAGKSTLLAGLAGLRQPAGQIAFLGTPLEQWPGEALARHRAWLTQQQTPPFAMPVWHYLALHRHGSTDEPLFNDITDALRLTTKLTRPVNQLSGGEWQRVRLAAVILQIHPRTNPQGTLLLLDEPMNSLDVTQQAALDTLLQQLCEQGVSVVMSSHDLNHTLRRAHRVWLLQNGKMIAEGDSESVMTPAHLAKVYGIDFQRVQIEGHHLLVCP
ncbi:MULTISPECIES: vitamin B12 ABC transporter ATP-binding protein BtuD [Atlantibacter]|uniref:Vitamin B12 import ATP-binding protein BtuD n=1 Tax=Atlantibacter hermannii NBRC 105704 TaxID=1115512 RepID=H5UYQ0_ATLHE|nr:MULTISPECIES: vitamin B12 ABC transporter ATP-binding protein BtuD [Atlantibacter]KIU34808.1 vitamin B12-transporter ATPase [Atlantibacter hermannii]MDQ7881419.1 vitamin B12 ABC transporter ATP-binding protein BtuD [Atlantibacter hermannii]QPS93877.1 vitamin B12 ABC transporter ATP-binding protein BtuD [Atlantibacter hermannii]VDZ73193.1 vitamin B12 ABC transporter, ATP-binding protein [Atlantibacter hermannii]GAB50054.1 vitamin B12 ABC transporter ATP-binding protein [Atlantibacter hermann